MAEDEEAVNNYTFRNFSRFQWTVLAVFGVVNFVSAMTYSIQAPFYPAEAEKRNATAFEYGLVFSSYELTALLLCPLLGSYMYLIGSKNGFYAGVLVAGISMILFGFLDLVNERLEFVIISLLLRVMQGTGTSALFVSIYSFLTVHFNNSIATVFALMESAFGAGICLGPVLGETLYQIGGFKLPFLAFGGFLVFSPVVAYFILEKTGDSSVSQSDEENNNGSRYGSVVNLLGIPAILLNIFGTFIGGFTIGFVVASLQHHIKQFNLSPTHTGLMFLSYGFVYATTGPLIGCLCDRLINPQYVTMVGSILMLLAFFLIGPLPFIPLNPNVWLVLVALVLFGLALGSIYVSTFLLTMREAKKNNYPDNAATYSLCSGLWMGAVSLGSFAGPIIAGLLQDHFGFRNATYSIIALTSILSILLVASIVKRTTCGRQIYYIDNEDNDDRSLINAT